MDTGGDPSVYVNPLYPSPSDTPIYEKMLARWSGENPEEIKQQYGHWPEIRKSHEEFKFMQSLERKLYPEKFGTPKTEE